MQNEIILPPGVVPVVAAAHPFRQEVTRLEVPQGATVAEILATAQPDPVLRRHALVEVGDVVIRPEYYSRVRPKAGTRITIRVLPAGGGQGGGDAKSIIRTIGLVIIAVVAAYFGQVQVGAAIFGSGTLGAAATGAAIGAAAAVPGPLHRATILPAPAA